MFRLIKIIFNAFILVLVFTGFNAIGGQKYVEMITTNFHNFMQERAAENAKKIGDFSGLHEEFQIDNSVNLLGYKAVLAEHKASGQRMCIVDSGKKPLLTKKDITSSELDKNLENLVKKFHYQALSIKEIKVVNHGTMKVYGQSVPYAKFEAKTNKFPLSDLTGIVASVQTSDGSEKLALSISEKKKYSQLITDEFYRNVKEN